MSAEEKQAKLKASIDADVRAIREGLARAQERLIKIQKIIAGEKVPRCSRCGSSDVCTLQVDHINPSG